jgi:hypothetical protein
MMDDDECESVDRMIAIENRSTRSNPESVLLCPPQMNQYYFVHHKSHMT